jgi:hypothetical protein
MTKTISFDLPKAEYDVLVQYADRVGMDIGSFVRQSASYFMRMDVLCVREAEMKLMEFETRKSELISRQKKADGVEKKPREPAVTAARERGSDTSQKPAASSPETVVSSEDLNVFVDSSVSSNDLESHVAGIND